MIIENAPTLCTFLRTLLDAIDDIIQESCKMATCYVPSKERKLGQNSINQGALFFLIYGSKSFSESRSAWD